MKIRSDYITVIVIIIFYIVSLILSYNLGRKNERILYLESPATKDSIVTFEIVKPAISRRSFVHDSSYSGIFNVDTPHITGELILPIDTATNSYITRIDTVLAGDSLSIRLLTDVPVRGVWQINLSHVIKEKLVRVFIPEPLSWYEKPYTNFLFGFISAILVIIFL